jgi:hypothetical protein
MARAERRRLARWLCAYVASFGYWVAGPQVQPPLSFEKYPTFLGNAIPPTNPFRDNLTVVPFSVPITQTVNVSGGGNALALAVFFATPGTHIIVQDSLNYNAVAIANLTNLTITAAPGQTPTITAPAGLGNNCIQIQAGNSGLKISGLIFIGSGNGGSGNQTRDGLINGCPFNGMASIDRVIIENCLFSEGIATVTSGAPAVQLIGTDGSIHVDVWIHRCTALDCGSNPITTANGYSTFEVSGFSNVYIQNSEVNRDSNLPRANSNMRGFGWKSINVVVEDCLVNDIGTNGENEGFKQHQEAVFGTAVGNSTVRNCVVYNGKQAYRITLAGTTMTVTSSVAYNGTLGIAAGQTFVRQTAGTMIFENGIIEGAGDGTAFDATVTENHNDVFNVAAPGKVLDATDLTINPLFNDAALNDYRAEAPAVKTGASDGGTMGVRYPGGEIIIWAGV